MANSIFSKTGWPFLPRIVNDGQRLSDLSYTKDIRESLDILFTTLPGERLAHPLYGCDLLQFMFRPINNGLLSSMKNVIQTAITLYETRVEVLRIEITPNPTILHQLDIVIDYKLVSTSSRFNVTIPFYTMEQRA
jgi:phage baseplate assembly protein W